VVGNYKLGDKGYKAENNTSGVTRPTDSFLCLKDLDSSYTLMIPNIICQGEQTATYSRHQFKLAAVDGRDAHHMSAYIPRNYSHLSRTARLISAHLQFHRLL
jgi:hypothetical protein